MDDVKERFWAHVQPAPFTECWVWLGSKTAKGYGQFNENGHTRRAHRLAYQYMVAEIPAGLQLDHLCRNTSCVNPWHLEPVTAAVNMDRGTAKYIVGKWELAKTHCPAGHPYDEQNTYRPPGRNSRGCRTCLRAQAAAAQARRKTQPNPTKTRSTP